MRTKPNPPPTVRGESPEVPWDPPLPRRRPPAKWHPTRPAQKLIKLAKQWLAPAFVACVVVLGTAAAGSGDGDWVLLVPGEEPICTKSLDTCNTARDALAEGRWRPVGTDRTHKPFQYIICKPSPGCFDDRSLCIPGYEGPRAEGYCR